MRIVLLIFSVLFLACSGNIGLISDHIPQEESTKTEVQDTLPPPSEPIKIEIEKDFLYDKYTLEDTYSYKDTTRSFQWDKIRQNLEYIETIEMDHSSWAYFRNKSNVNGEAPLVRNWHRNDHNLVSDSAGVARYQSVPLYLPSDTITPERYGQDGALARFKGEEGNYYKVEDVNFPGTWLVPKRYLKRIDDSITRFDKIIFVDRRNQNITSLEKSGHKWLVRSMNPATTGLHRPPYQHPTPLGIFVIQEKRPKMIYLRDGSSQVGGFSPWASRFCRGAYLHGVPVNHPGTAIIEYSATLGTTPRSHMCVRTATSHAKFLYDWAPVDRSLVVVIE